MLFVRFGFAPLNRDVGASLLSNKERPAKSRAETEFFTILYLQTKESLSLRS